MPGLERVFTVTRNLLNNCYCIVDQTRPSEAVALYHSLQKDIEQNGHIMFVFNGAYNPLGFIKGKISRLHSDFLTSEIEFLFVDKKYQSAGIGTSLIQAYEDFCRKENVQKISLYSAKTVQARAFYEKHGYVLQNVNYLMSKKLER